MDEDEIVEMVFKKLHPFFNDYRAMAKQLIDTIEDELTTAIVEWIGSQDETK